MHNICEQAYWDALQEALRGEVSISLFKLKIVSPSMSLFLFKPHCSSIFESNSSDMPSPFLSSPFAHRVLSAWTTLLYKTDFFILWL